MKNLLVWAIKIGVAIILVQTLYFKFSGAPESVYIFEQTGLGKAGRIGSGIAELIAASFLLIPKYAWAGATMALGIISGAIFFHLTSLGIEVQGDGGTLFYLAVAVFIGSAVTLWIERKHVIEFIDKIKG